MREGVAYDRPWSGARHLGNQYVSGNRGRRLLLGKLIKMSRGRSGNTASNRSVEAQKGNYILLVLLHFHADGSVIAQLSQLLDILTNP